MPKKLTYDYVKQYFQDNNCELLETEYINNYTKMRYKCVCGRFSKISFNSFKRGSRCKKCGSKKASEKNKLSYNYVRNYFKNNSCELLEKEYINSFVKMEYRCSCGNISKIAFSNFQKGQRCRKCSTEKRKLSYEYIYNYFKKHDCELLETEYKNNYTKMKYKCSCGNNSEITFGNFQKGKRCIKCGRTEKFTFEYVFNFFKEYNCELLETEYNNVFTKMGYKCSCGNISESNFDNFKRYQGCRNCSIKKRAGKNHYNYNSNLTDEERETNRSRTSDLFYKKWRKKVYIRDNYICQKCFQRGAYLNAHHIESWDINEDLRLEESNGITFCKDCHKEFHKKYGRGNNNRKQLDYFLKINMLIFNH